jgi:hypothetical protein
LFGAQFPDPNPGPPTTIFGADILRSNLQVFSASLFDTCVLLWDPIPSALPPGTQVVAVPEQPWISHVPDLRKYPLGPQPQHFKASFTYWCDSHFWPAGQRYTDATVAGTLPCEICFAMNSQISNSLQPDPDVGTASQLAKDEYKKEAFLKCTKFGSSFLHHAWVKARLKYILARAPGRGRARKPTTVRLSRLKKKVGPDIVYAHTLVNDQVRVPVEQKRQLLLLAVELIFCLVGPQLLQHKSSCRLRSG